MELQITTFYVLCCELLSALNICEAPQTKMNNAEVMTVVLTAARFFGGNFRTSAQFLEDSKATPCARYPRSHKGLQGFFVFRNT